MTRGGPDSTRGTKPDTGSVAVFGGMDAITGVPVAGFVGKFLTGGLRILSVTGIDTGGFQPLGFRGRLCAF